MRAEERITKILHSIEEQLEKPRYKATVKMKKPWISKYAKKPTQDMILEALADEILSGEIDEIFEITIEKAEKPLEDIEIPSGFSPKYDERGMPKKD